MARSSASRPPLRKLERTRKSCGGCSLHVRTAPAPALDGDASPVSAKGASAAPGGRVEAGDGLAAASAVASALASENRGGVACGLGSAPAEDANTTGPDGAGAEAAHPMEEVAGSV